MATTKITSPELFDLGSLNTALQLPSGTTAERPASPSTGEWRYNTTTNLIEFYDGGEWRDLQSEDIPPTPSENFNTVLWTGNGSGQSITGVGYAPDFVWLKNRDQNNYSHRIFDTSRGPLKVIKPSGTGAESTDAGSLTSFDSDGFTLGNDVYVNNSGDDFVGWTMKVNGGTTVSNTDGTNTSTVQLNSKAKFSIVEWNGGVAEHSVGHGLGVKPEVVIIKELGASSNWNVYYDVVDGSLDFATLNNDNAGANSSRTMWTSSVFYWSGTTTTDCVAYCFTSVAQFSKFGSYTGTGSATNRPIINTGFEPAFVMIKSVSTGGTAPYNWSMYDNKRNTSNPRDKILEANKSDAEITASTTYVDFFTNGFQIGPATSGRVNGSGVTYLYMAFASDPSAAPVLADSFGLTTYTGDGASGNSITGLSFKPSLLWIKSYAGTVGNWSHQVMDSMRGASSSVSTNNQNSETINSNGLESFDSNGFTVGSGAGGWNYSGSNYVAWAWKANTLPSINTDGAQTALVNANVAAGFSIVQLPNNAGTYTVGHGLDGVPDLIILKQYQGGTGNWSTYNSPVGVRNFMNLNTDAANTVATPGYEYDSVTATTFTNLISNSTYSYIHYCFKSVPGFSKIGSYTGNGSTQSITGVGFQPNWLMIKQTNGANSWRIFDSARGLSAPQTLFSNLDLAADSESNTVSSFDSDGWTMGSQQGVNDNGDNYIYIAFKQNASPQPLVGFMSFLVIAGGGSGGANSNSGGAGAGGLRTSYGANTGGGAPAESNITLAAGTYTITVGAGGAAQAFGQNGATGSSSSIAATSITTINTNGGGGGSRQGGTAATGGSGGGGAYDTTGAAGTSGQGYAGGAGTASGDYPGGGGGGAAESGNGSGAGAGGNGLAVSITGSSVAYAGGGAGGCSAGGTVRIGGTGGGGNGAEGDNTAPIAGGTNLGGGGGGGAAGTPGAAGGSGVVILRLKTSEYSGTTTGSPTVTTDDTHTILTYTGSGTYVHS